MLVDSVKKKSEQKSINDSEGTPGKPMSTSKLSTSDSRMTIKIPKNTKLYDFLSVDKNYIKKAKWEALEQVLEIAQQTKEDYAEKIFDEFVIRMGFFYPEKTEKLKKLRQLILWQIIMGEQLTEEYYKKLEEL